MVSYISLQGNSICCHVHGFHPYFFIEAPKDFTKDHLPDFRRGLNEAILADMKSNKEDITEPVLNVELLQKSTIYGFQASWSQNS